MYRIQKSLAFLLTVTMLVCLLGTAPFSAGAAETAFAASSAATTYQVSTAEQLDSARIAINESGGKAIINLMADINTGISITNSSAVVTIIGNGHTLSSGGAVVSAWNGAAVNLGDGNSPLILTSEDNNDTEGIVYVMGSDSTCNMYDKVTLKDHKGSNNLGGGVTVNAGTFNMYGGTIVNCGIEGGSVCYGGGVAVYSGGTFNMSGGTISECYVASDFVETIPEYKDHYVTAMGGGVFVASGSEFNMSGGTIENNTAANFGGGVCVAQSFREYNQAQKFGFFKSRAEITGGTISENKAKSGAGVFASGIHITYFSEHNTAYVDEPGDNDRPGVDIEEGIITGNIASENGGGVYFDELDPSLEAFIRNATISENRAVKGAGICIFKFWTQTYIDNSIIKNNVASSSGGGVYIQENRDRGSKGTHIKDTTITENLSADRGAGIYYDDKSKLTISGKNIIQDNTYNDKLNNLNVYSVDNPVYIDGDLTGSQIGLSDPRLWDDNLTDAEAPDDGSAELLTNGYKENNPDVHPGEYFTSDHETWIVDRTELKKNTKVINRYKYENTQAYTSIYMSSTYNGILLGCDPNSTNLYIVPLYLKAESFDVGYAQSVEQIYNEMLTRYKKHYTEKEIGESTSVFTTDDDIEVTLEKQSDRVVVTSKSITYPSRYTTLTATLSNQSSRAADGEIYFTVSGSAFNRSSVYNTSGTSPQAIPTFYNTQNRARAGSLLYDEIGRIIAKVSTTANGVLEKSEQTSFSGGDEVKLIRRTTPLKFHDNKDTVNEGEDRLFRVYNADDESLYTVEDGFHDLPTGRVEEFYSIPSFANDDYVFAGWYTVKDNDNNDRANAFEFDSFVSSEVEDVYAHWIEVVTVAKDSEDNKTLPSSMDGKYSGFGLFGIQIRPEAQFDLNKGEYYYGGLRFITSVSESLLSDIDDLSDKTVNGNKVEYGYVTAAKATVETFLNRIGHSGEGYKIGYKGENVNGVDTTVKQSTTDNYRYITNIDCTSTRGGYGSDPRVTYDHGNYTGYRLITFVVNYTDKNCTAEELEAHKASDIVARAYLRYYDANGLLRTFYNDYDGNNVYGGCSVSYKTAKELITGNVKTEITQ